ncbi:MAG TPA: two-component regulator propeller domain-containing protein [Parafilimonas sp.]|nr:two-component regulator propeller domain-containing protein [Parafilimonas sp.]
MGNGLSDNDVNCFLQDRQGFMWIGTNDGLNRYDGYNFKVYQPDALNKNSLSSAQVNCLYEDKNGLIWIGTASGGLNSFNPKTEKFSRWVRSDTTVNSISDNTVNAICADSNNSLWIATASGLNFFNPATEEFKIYHHKEGDVNSIARDNIYSLYLDKQNRLWIGTYGAGIDMLNTATGKIRHISRFATSGVPDNSDYIRKIIQANDTLLYASSDKELLGINLINYHVSFVTHSEKNGEGEIQCLLKDDNNLLWMGTRNAGLVIYDPSTRQSINYRADEKNQEGLSDNYVRAIYKDREGGIWIGMLTTGIHRINLGMRNFKVLKAKEFAGHEGKDNYIFSFAEDNDSNLWVGTFNAGFHQFKKQNDEYAFVKNYFSGNTDLINQFVISLEKGNGNDIWLGHFGGGEGVSRFVPGNESLEHFTSHTAGGNSIAENNVVSLLWDPTGILWIGTARSGLDEYNMQTKKFYHHQHNEQNPESISDNWVNAIKKDKAGTIWLATGDGLNKMNKDGSFTHFLHDDKDPFSLSYGHITCMNIDDNGIIWMGTESGDLDAFQPSSKKFLNIKLFGGKKKCTVQGLLIDNSGKIWISTDAEIVTFDPPKNFSSFFTRSVPPEFKEMDKYFQDYDKSNGVPFNSFNQYSYYKGKDGKLYFGSTNGALIIDPEKFYLNAQPARVLLTNFSLFNKEVTAGDSTGAMKEAISYAREITLKSRQNVFSIEFTSASFTDPTKNRFAYMLQGFDKDWIFTDYKKRSTTYTNLHPGEYTFKVKASNSEGVWNEDGTSLKIIILPAWWQTWLFKIALAISLFALIFFAIRYYFRQKLKLQQEQFERERAIETVRARISEDIHDEIGSGLTKISLMSQRIRMHLENKKEFDPELLQKLTESSKEVVTNLGEIIWTVNPKYDNLPSLLAYIRNYVSNFFEHTSVDCSIDFPVEIPADTISPDLKHNLFLVIKESLNNILKHAEATAVTVHSHLDSSTFYFEITDNGRGIDDMKGRQFGNGLLNMKNRMEAVKGKFEIQSTKNVGTKITLEATLLH